MGTIPDTLLEFNVTLTLFFPEKLNVVPVRFNVSCKVAILFPNETVIEVMSLSAIFSFLSFSM